METTSAIQKFHPKARPVTRCRRSSAQPAKKRTARHPADGFLKAHFLPFWAIATRNYRQMEAEFFRSLAHLCALYDLPVPDVSATPFPQNVTVAYMKISEAVKAKDKNANCIIVKDDTRNATLAVLKSHDTGRCLYYIPVRPLWNLVQTAKEQPLANLLTSIYGYLYQIAKVPYYTENDAYLFYQYDTIERWIDEDDEEEQEHKDEQIDALHELTYAGNRVVTLIRDPIWLADFEANIKAYKETETWDLETECLATEFLALFKEYSTQTLFDNIHDDLIEPEETERVRAEQYISFYWSGNDCFYDMLFEMVNNEFQECGITDEPMSVQYFDTPQTQITNELNFERRLFDLIDKLCAILNPYDND